MRGVAVVVWVTGAAGVACGHYGPWPGPEVVCSAQHVWEDYHLNHGSLSPGVINTSSYTPDLAAWNDLGTPVQLRNDGSGFAITIEDGGDAGSSWLGLASVRVGSGGHISSATVTMNRALLAKYDSTVADHVLCQEIGHLLGLDHQRNADDSCMDDLDYRLECHWPKLLSPCHNLGLYHLLK